MLLVFVLCNAVACGARLGMRHLVKTHPSSEPQLDLMSAERPQPT